MTHQYVGAYYVPHGWYENYDAGFQYEPLSTVFYKNAWYILKQPAPVGTEPTNSQYWAQYNLVPGQIIDIENQLNDLNNDVINLQNSQGNLSQRSILFIGDSYMEGVGDNVTNTFVNQFVDSVKLLNYEILTKSGAGFYANNYGDSFITLLNKATIKNPTDIVVCGGRNDLNEDESNVETAINTFINICNEKYPNANIIIAFIPNLADLNLPGNPSNMNKIYDKKIFLQNMSFILTDRTLISSDGIHPNQAGHNALYKGLYNYLLFNSYNHHNKYTCTLSDSELNISGTLTFDIFNNTFILSNPTLNANITSISYTGASNVKIGALSNFPVKATNYGKFLYNVNESNEWRKGAASAQLTNNILYISMEKLGTGGYVDFTINALLIDNSSLIGFIL